MAEVLGRSERRRSNIQIAALRAFVSAADAGGFSAAAANLGISQPAISFQIAGLESAYSVVLFRRRPKLALTEVGRDILARARLILAHADALEDALVAPAQLKRATLKIGYTSANIVMPILAPFLNAYPLVRMVTVEDETAALLARLGDGHLDLMVSPIDQLPDDMVATRIGETRLCIAAPKGHTLLSARKDISLKELADEKIVMRRDAQTQMLFQTSCMRAGVTPDVRILVDSQEALVEAILHKVGVGVMFSRELRDIRLRCVGIAEVPPVGIYAIFHQELQDWPTVRAFLNFAPRYESLYPSAQPERT